MNNKLGLKVYPKTIYNDVVGMPDPVLLGVTIHYYNHSDTNLYMKIFGSGPSPWSSNSVELGLLNSGGSAYINLDNFLSRTKPTSETTEQITLTLRGYSDAGYSTLVYTFARDVTVIFIKSDDGSWTLNEDDDFDDGTAQGWDVAKEAGHATDTVSKAVVTDYVLSTPYSLKAEQDCKYGIQQRRFRLYKSFTTPDKAQVYAIMNVRATATEITNESALKYLEVRRDAVTLIHLGKTYDSLYVLPKYTYIPYNTWMRIVVPLPKNVTLEVRIALCLVTHYRKGYLWLEDFKIVSK